MTKKMLMAVACLGASVVPAMMAQSMETVRFNLPYEAKVGNVTLPAGQYSIRDMKDLASSSVLEISSLDHKGSNTFVTVKQIVSSKKDVDHTSVILRKDDNGYQIQTIWLEGQDVGFQIAE
jgi:hypothetical protein